MPYLYSIQRSMISKNRIGPSLNVPFIYFVGTADSNQDSQIHFVTQEF